MSEKALKVLAACVDSRSGKRFEIGETFDPPPTELQAARLVKAGCLPDGAIEVGKKYDADNEKKIEAEARKQAKAVADAKALADANAEVASATVVLRDAEDRATAAQSA